MIRLNLNSPQRNKVMDKTQQQLILELAKRLKQDKKSRSQSLKILESTGIIPQKGNINKQYPNLNRALKQA
jgi:predicted transcriptional regulator